MTQQTNPHFDDDRVVWRDEYSGTYSPPADGYSNEFELQWRLALEGDPSYENHAGASTSDEYIDDRVYEWTGRHPNGGGLRHAGAGVRRLDVPVDVALVRGKRCVDVGCGMGRWTKTMLKLGASSVLSIDVSESGLDAVRKFNDNVLAADVTTLSQAHPELREAFDFGVSWGVVHHTHDPASAFANAAYTIAPGGSLYLMVYAPEGVHGLALTTRRRRRFHMMRSVSDRLRYVDSLAANRWDPAASLLQNTKQLVKRVVRRPAAGKVGILDMLEPFYNWVIPIRVAENWFAKHGFGTPVLLNHAERPKCAYHLLGTKR